MMKGQQPNMSFGGVMFLAVSKPSLKKEDSCPSHHVALRGGAAAPGFLLILLALFSLAPSGSAATLTVTNANDSGAGSLRGALAAAGSGDTIAFGTGAFPANGSTVITLTSGPLAVSQNLTLQGPGAGLLTVSGAGQSRVFTVASGVTAGLSGLTIASGNAGNQFGGGIDNAGTLTVTGCTLSNNAAYFGGGIRNTGTLTVSGCTLSGNSSVSGGGIYSSGGTLMLINSTLSGNTASDGAGGGNGGGIDSSTATVTLTGCTLSGNVAGSGGGISRLGGTMTLTNCTFSGNATVSGGFGAGIYNGGSGTSGLVLTNCTLAGNTAAQSGKGGGIFNASAATVQSCIINGNSAAGGGPDVFGSVTSGGSNLIGDPNGAAYGFTQTHDLIAVDPKLDPNGLGSNGGPTQTIAVLAGSPAIGGDFNDATSNDQRGFTRNALEHTIGAYEYKTSHTHLLWNNSDGRVMLWSVAQDGTFTLNGFGPYTDTYVSNSPQNKWSATAVATGPDGKSHLLWNNTDGRVMLWTVDDSGSFTLAGYGPYTDGYVNNSPSNVWHATAVSVGPDNVVHLLWNNTDHRVMLWNVDSSFNFTLAGYGPYTDNFVSSDPGNLWSATALATGPDNVTRIAWNNVDGRVMLWDVNAGFSFTLAGYGPYTDGAPQNKWSAVGVSVGPDNVQHLLWSNTDRRAMFWDVDSSFNFTLAGYGPYTDNAPQNLWSVTALATGPDGLSHFLWDNTDYRAMLWGVNNAFNFSVTGYGPYTDNAPGNLWSATAVSAGP